MPKSKLQTMYVCSECGNESSIWEGQCRVCRNWNTFEEIKINHNIKLADTQNYKVKKLTDIKPEQLERISTQISELDRTLGSGLVQGQVILLGGNPGIGKSTLILQMAANYKGKVLYVSGEESESQIALRAKRLNINSENIDLLSTGNMNAALSSFKHDLLIIDSIQTVALQELPSSPGSVTQIRECTYKILELAKTSNIPAVLIGHITKEGSIAGPKILEHMVDTVLYLEGDKNNIHRLLRVYKNRFGDDAEVGIFKMETSGMIGIDNPANAFIDSESLNKPGSAVAITMEGSRPIAVEVQALTTKTSFGYPKRASSGFSVNRLQLLCAVLQKIGGINLVDQDVYVNISSGLNVKEPGIDLAVCAAIISSYREKKFPHDTSFFGEVGLTGEVRAVVAQDRRGKESKIQGFKKSLSSSSINNIREIHNYLV